VALEPHHTKNIPSTDSANNPFDTIFDGESDDAEDEWWEEEDTVTSTPPKPRTDVRITQWPRPSEGIGLGLNTKPLNRSSTRKPAKRYSVQKPTRDKSKGRQRKQNAKAGIKVVTNFSRHQAAAPPVQMQPSQTAPQMGYFVDLAALQALNGDFGSRRRVGSYSVDRLPFQQRVPQTLLMAGPQLKSPETQVQQR
jgi:hypothetical protein